MINALMRQRLFGAYVGNACARFMRIAEQLLLVPLLIAAWGVERYGEWVALTAIATFATVSNLGIGHASRSDIILRCAGGRTRDAARSFMTGVVLIALVVAGGCALLAIALAVFDVGAVISLQSIPAGEGRTIIALVGLSALLTFLVEPLNGAIGAELGAGPINLLFAGSRVVELAAIAIAVRLSATPSTVAVIILATAVLYLLTSLAVAVRYARWISFKISDFDAGVIARTWRASLGYFALFVCVTVIYVQVPRLVVFEFLGPVALATFSTLVTYTRAARMFALAVSQPAQVEIGRAFANQRLGEVKKLIETILGASVGVATLVLAIELAAAPILVPLWTHGQVGADWNVLVPLAFVTLIGAYFDAAMVPVGATNQVSLVAVAYAMGLLVALAGATLLIDWLGVAIVALSLLLPDLAGAVAALRTLHKVLPSACIRMIPLPFTS